jgi:hypothetical protein
MKARQEMLAGLAGLMASSKAMSDKINALLANKNLPEVTMNRQLTSTVLDWQAEVASKVKKIASRYMEIM